MLSPPEGTLAWSSRPAPAGDLRAILGAVPDPLAVLAASVAARLVARRETVAVAESSAGGLISAALLSIPGASAYFLGGAVIYTQAARRALIRVPDDAVAGMRASTEAYALLKARTVRDLLG